MRFILHIDMNSFFATVEQQANPFLRGRPIGVGGRPGKRSVIATCSIEAKALGVKTAMGTQEALAICPDLLLVTGDNEKYHDVSRRVIAIIIQQTPQVEVFSLDECFADITCQVARATDPWQRAVDIACQIKADIRRQIGDYISCSIGLAPNKFLAKLAGDTFKPDGLQVVVPNDYTSKLEQGQFKLIVPSVGASRSRLLVKTVDELVLKVDLEDFCGIGRRIRRHLARLGINSVAALRQADKKMISNIFGVVGERLQNYAWGEDSREVAVHYEQPLEKSFSHSITMPAQYYTAQDAKRFLYHQCERVGRKMRARGFATRQISAWWRFADLTFSGGHITLKKYVRDGREIYTQAEQIFDQNKSFKPIRLVGVAVSLLVNDAQLSRPLLLEERRCEQLLDALDLINNRFGEGVALRASAMMVKKAQAPAAHAYGFKFFEIQ